MEIFSDALIPGLIAVIVTYFFNKYNDYIADINCKISFLYSILAEINALKILILVREREFKLPDSEDISDYKIPHFPIYYSYITVYENSATMIGKLDNNELMDMIIRTYVDIKGLFENLKDLDFYAKVLQMKFVYKPEEDVDRTLLLLHYNFSKEIIINQVPKTEQNLDILTIALNNEILVYNKKKTIWKFICSLF